jgi:ketosteroid isomerase-like protein
MTDTGRAMPGDNVELLREIYDRVAAGDADFFYASLDPEVVWDERDTPWPEAGVYHGVPAVRDFLRRWLGTWDRFEWIPRDFVDAGEHVVVTVRQRGVGKSSNIEIDQTRSQVWTFRDGKVVAFRSFVDREHALQAVGSSGR